MLSKVAFGQLKQKPVLRSQSQVSQLTSSKSLAHSNTLSDVLQTTLDVNELLSIYVEFINSRLDIESLQFVSDDQIFSLLGNYHQSQRQHAVMLYADKDYLGQLIYGLKHPLSMPQQMKLEQWHRELTFPLRNAIKFSQLHRLAVRDHLTGLGNRALLEEVLEHLHITQQRQQDARHAVMLLDLDGFKEVNDEHGHQQGDDILRIFAELLKTTVRDSDQVFRFGGDEFVVVMEHTTLYQAQEVYNRIREAVAASDMLSRYQLSTSAGTAQLECFNTVDETLAEADQRLYQAKHKGKNRHCGSIGCN